MEDFAYWKTMQVFKIYHSLMSLILVLKYYLSARYLYKLLKKTFYLIECELFFTSSIFLTTKDTFIK